MNYILIHGAWHGSWCWRKVARHLQNLGHTVTTPDLPGHYLNACDFKKVSLGSYVEYHTTRQFFGVEDFLSFPRLIGGFV